MSEATLFPRRSAMNGKHGAAGTRRIRPEASHSGAGLWATLSQKLWHGSPVEVFSDHLLDDIGVSRFELCAKAQ